MALKLKPHFETEVYVSQGGYVALKQPGSMGDEDSLVLLAADQLPDIIIELQALYDDRRSWAFPDESETDAHDAKPPT